MNEDKQSNMTPENSALFALAMSSIKPWSNITNASGPRNRKPKNLKKDKKDKKRRKIAKHSRRINRK